MQYWARARRSHISAALCCLQATHVLARAHRKLCGCVCFGALADTMPLRNCERTRRMLLVCCCSLTHCLDRYGSLFLFVHVIAVCWCLGR